MILVAVIITTFFIVVAFLVSAILKAKFFRSAYKRYLRLVIVVLSVLYIFTAYSVYKNAKPTELIIGDKHIEFTGNYGEKISLDNIQNIQQISLFPEIESRQEGFSLMNIRKGNFETKSGEIVHLLLNGKDKPILKITKKNTKKVLYFNSSKKNMKEEYTKLQNIFSYKK